MDDSCFGHIVPPSEARILQDDILPGAETQTNSPLMAGTGNALWSYHNEGKIYGYPVLEEDRDLAIERDEEILQKFEPKREAHSEMFWMSPDDEESIKRYDNILKMVTDGTINIIEENKQYDASRGAYLVWIRYDKVWFQLHPRFRQLREDTNG